MIIGQELSHGCKPSALSSPSISFAYLEIDQASSGDAVRICRWIHKQFLLMAPSPSFPFVEPIDRFIDGVFISIMVERVLG